MMAGHVRADECAEGIFCNECHRNGDPAALPRPPVRAAYLATVWLGSSVVNRLIHSPFCSLMATSSLLRDRLLRAAKLRDLPPANAAQPLLLPARRRRWACHYRDCGGRCVARCAVVGLASIVAALAAYATSASFVGFIWGRASAYPYFFSRDRSNNSSMATAAKRAGSGGHSSGGDSSGLDLLASIAIGTAGGLMWSLLLAVVLVFPAVWLWRSVWAPARTFTTSGVASPRRRCLSCT